MLYNVDRFYAAISVLAGHGHIKQRLMRAYEENLVEIADEDLPVAVKQAFADIRHQMHRVTPLKGESPVCASVRKMSPVEASECAVSIVSMYSELLRQANGGQGALPLAQDERPGVPPFLIKSV